MITLSRTSMRILWVFLAQFALDVNGNMSCLVMRPGYGLVSEDCPSHAVGCRIRAKKDHIEWYELSRLYDRNQLVCVYPEEYKSLTGCMRKPSGSTRCWCGGRENCNDPETSRDLYEAYAEGDNEAVQRIAEWLKSPKDESSWKKFTTTEETPTTEVIETTTSRRIIPKKKVTPATKIATKLTTTSTVAPTTTTAKKAETTSSTTTTTTTTTTKRPITTTSESVISTTKKAKRIGMEKSTAVPKVLKAKTINIVDIREKGNMLPRDDDISLDQSFEETRKKLEKEMREEDERLREMLADEEEEEENSNDIDEMEEDVTAEGQREMERERYRMERRRAEENRMQEDVILRRIEEDEIRAAEKERNHPIDPYGREFDEPGSSSSFISGFLVFVIVLLF